MSDIDKKISTLVLLGAIGIFVLDLLVPLGVAVGVLYLVLVIFLPLSKSTKIAVIYGVLSTALIVIVFAMQLSENTTWMAYTNRFISIGAIWVGAILSIRGMITERKQEERKALDREKLMMKNQELSETKTALLNVLEDYKEAQNELKESEQLYRYLYEYAHEMYCSVDPKDASVKQCNNTLCTKLGYSKEEVIGKPVFNLYHPDCIEDVQKAFDQFVKTGTVQDAELSLKTKKGEKIDVLLNVSAVKDEQNNILYSRSSWVDVSEQNKRKQLLENQNKELEQFAYIASHDLQEPLRTVSSFTDLLAKEHAGKLGENGDKYLSFLQTGAERMSNLIKGLLDYSRIGRNKKQEVANVNILLEEITEDLSILIEESKATISIGTMPVSLQSYPLELKQLFQNLISNAIKFQKKGSNPKIHITAEERTDAWQFAVSDNGIGIAQELQEKIFMIFQRLHTRGEYEGTGIGLAHCKKIVEQHGGKIWVESEEGKGTTFLFR